MGQHRRPAERSWVDEGSATLDGIAAIGLALLLLTVVAQMATGIIATGAARAAASSSARAAALPGAAADAIEHDLAETVEAIVPGALSIRTRVRTTASASTATVWFRWLPPGPGWVRPRFRISVTVPLITPP